MPCFLGHTVSEVEPDLVFCSPSHMGIFSLTMVSFPKEIKQYWGGGSFTTSLCLTQPAKPQAGKTSGLSFPCLSVLTLLQDCLALCKHQEGAGTRTNGWCPQMVAWLWVSVEDHCRASFKCKTDLEQTLWLMTMTGHDDHTFLTFLAAFWPEFGYKCQGEGDVKLSFPQAFSLGAAAKAPGVCP